MDESERDQINRAREIIKQSVINYQENYVQEKVKKKKKPGSQTKNKNQSNSSNKKVVKSRDTR